MKQRARRWTVVVSALAAGVASGLVALPTGAGAGPPEGPPDPNCELFDAGTGEFEGFNCAELQVTKVVTGEAPAGTTFEVEVDCGEAVFGPLGGEDELVQAQQDEELPRGHVPPFTETLTFGEEGGTQTLLVGAGTTCTLSEEAPAPCTLVGIEPNPVEIAPEDTFNKAVVPVTVTNACPAAPAAPQAPPAPAAAAQPRFTG